MATEQVSMKSKQSIRMLLRSLLIIYPLLVVWLRDLVIAVQTPGAFMFLEEFGPRLLQSVIADIPLFFLVSFANRKLRHHALDEVLAGLLGATIAVVGASLIIHGYYVYSALTWQGGPVIGPGMLLLMFFSPLYLPVFIWVGFAVGHRLAGRH